MGLKVTKDKNQLLVWLMNWAIFTLITPLSRYSWRGR